MNKIEAANLISNAGINLDEIAHSIYLATVRGVSGANQNQGYGFHLSAMAELWNIRGTIKNPNGGRTIITNRYKGIEVTEDMIWRVVQQYPDGIAGYSPTFDELLGINTQSITSMSGWDESENDTEKDIENTYVQNKASGSSTQDELGKLTLICMIAVFVILKIFVGWGWIVSIIIAILGGAFISGAIESVKK